MKKFLTFVLLTILANCMHAAGVIIVDGSYQGKNLYVNNPFAGSGVGFCVYEVTVNEQVTTDEINSNAFEIDFTVFQFKIGDKIEVKIKHKDDCKPKVINPDVLKPKSTFEVTSMKIEKDGMLKWSTKAETGKLPYIIEQFRWNKWVRVGEVDGLGAIDNNEYSFKVTAHSGKNQFRVKQIDYTSQPRISKPIDYVSSTQEVTFSPAKVSKDLLFSEDTMYEIYDQYGNVVKKGFGKQVDCGNLGRGIYYLNYDNKIADFIKK